MSGWTRPELPSGKGSQLSSHTNSSFWMTIVEQLSIGRVWQEEGERNGDASWSRRGTDPALLA
uniref:Uncharacterized protein n=1 Tax=Heterorhabditis bacteriophora TaxID=37862 RepID=A0A1I7XN30_HETBA